MPRAGLKNRRLYLQKPTRAINNTGEETETWSNVGLVYAEVMPQSGNETVESGQNSAKVTHKVRVNYRNDINTQRRFLIDGYPGVLNGAITNVATTVPVDDAAFVEFQQARRERILRIDNELMTVSSVSANNITVARGQFGTTAATHDDNAKVILHRPLNIESVYDPDGRKADLICECVEVT